jgi:hypothetical protein
MNLVCFPHYTCGGLLVDIFEKTFSSTTDNGGINSISHSLGKIGDSDTIFDNYNPADLLSKINQICTTVTDNTWAGTHCWPGILDTSSLTQVVVVTTTTYRSKLYRWLRAYYHYYEKSNPWLAVSGQERIDKERETAKNYLRPFLPVVGNNIINIEFAEIVEISTEFLKLTQGLEINNHMDRWKSINYFLYNDKVWKSVPFLRFYEAELENQLNKHYIYE